MFIFRLCALLSAVMLFNSSSLYAYPDKPLRLIVPIAPGGSNDILARALSEKLSTNLRQTVIVDNRPGGGGIIGTEIAAKAAGDGYTLLMVNISHALNPSMHAKLPYDQARGFAPITLIGSAPNAIVVHPSNSISSVKDLIASAKSTPGKLTYASAGNASSPHLAAELFKLMSETNLLHVPYKGSGPGLAALMGAEVSVSFPVLSSALSIVKSGRLKGIAVTSRERSSALPNIPTVRESGLSEYVFSAWFGCVAPSSTPSPLVDRLNKEIRVILDDAAFKAKYAAQGLELEGTTPQQFKQHLDDETSKWRKVISVSGIRLN
jgi:tripartite-type tricarboxylate transporter receptor subunit TctC